ncbi:hypothetical protein [Actinomadura terrae]|uniref:hypothetical protein n=1 Tax=Actinomadura terrae TaxID=604353 RepID=UPI001FA76A2D|nr:hypothetical protein [Actinomadura terrae]
MDIFPRSTDARTMESRRDILAASTKIAGVALAAPLLNAVAPYTRLFDERGSLAEELDRISRELDWIAVNEPLRPSSEIRVAIYATWANLVGLGQHTNRAVAALKARTAINAGANAITTMDSKNGPKWFDTAGVYARIAGDNDLISLTHYHESVAGIWWHAPDRTVRTSMYIAGQHGKSAQRLGPVYALRARLASQRYECREAVQAVEQSVHLAGDPEAPTLSTWTKPQAHAFAARSLVPFAQLLAAVEAHTHEALNTLPENAHVIRCHARLNLAEARAKSGLLDAAADETLKALATLPDNHGYATLIDRVATLSRDVDRRWPKNSAFEPVRELLKAEPV